MRDLQSAVLDPWLGAILLLVLGCGWIGLGIYWGRRAKNLEGFMLAGRNVGLALAAATAMATWVTSNTIMLAPLFGLKYGIWGMLAYSTASFGLFLLRLWRTGFGRSCPPDLRAGILCACATARPPGRFFFSLLSSIPWPGW
jgi:hypothetical protein